ncbi:MAG: hypothetical protein U0930_09215 [Pirellulales bacterium]
MRYKLLTLAALVALQTFAAAQPPGGGGGRGEGRGPGPGGQGGPGCDDPIARLMALDKNNDGRLTEDEYTDSRLKPLIERADADKNKIVTREELTAQMQREVPNQGGGPGGQGFGGGAFGEGRGGRGGMRGGMMMRPGTILPEFMVQELQLNDEQKAKLAKLQATVDAELAKILTEGQQQQMKQFGERGREGFGGREGGGREGFGREGFGREGFGREGGREGFGREGGGRPEGQGAGGPGAGGPGAGGPGAGGPGAGGPGGGRPEGQGGQSGPGDRPRF